MTQNHLIIFVKNPTGGQVKTGTARTAGDKTAVAVCHELQHHTQAITKPRPDHRIVYFGEYIDTENGWNGYGNRPQCKLIGIISLDRSKSVYKTA